MARYEIALLNYYPEKGEKPYMWSNMSESIARSGMNFVTAMMNGAWCWNLRVLVIYE